MKVELCAGPRRWPAYLLLLIIPLLSSCTGIMGMGVIGYGMVTETLQSRPDRSLQYEITVRTLDGVVITFQGETQCPHFTNLNSYRGHYTTTKNFSTVKNDGVTWVLSGINCDNEIVEKLPQKYLLYRVVDERYSKVYFAQEKGNAQIIDSSFNSSLFASKTEKRLFYNGYPNGPYIYTKYKLLEVPAASTSATQPFSIFLGASSCMQKEKGDLALSYDDYYGFQWRETKVDAVLKGHLSFNSGGDHWTFSPNRNPAVAMDVVSRESERSSKINPKTTAEDCMHVLLGNQTIQVSTRPSSIYVPAENALYRIEKLSQHEFVDRMTDKTLWRQCNRPAHIKNWIDGAAHYLHDQGKGFHFARQGENGAFFCTFSYDTR
ncbi:MAG: hypothetical protein ACO1PN_06075 [Betaproteobacteria bacterium]